MFSGLYDMGGGQGAWITVHIVSVDATLSGSGVEGKETVFLKHTHAHRLHIDHLVSRMYEFVSVSFYAGALSQRADIAGQTNPKGQKAHIHIQHNVWVFDVQQQNIAKYVAFFKGLFQMRCQLSGSTCNWCQIKHNIQYLLSPPKPPAYNHSLHRFLSVFTVGHPSHGVDLLVGPSAGERWYFLEAVVLLIKQDKIILIDFVSTG